MKNALLAIISFVLCACSNGQEQNSFRIIDSIPLGHPTSSFGNWLSENGFKKSNYYTSSLYFEQDLNKNTGKLYKVNYVDITEVKELSGEIGGVKYSGAILPQSNKGENIVSTINIFPFSKSIGMLMLSIDSVYNLHDVLDEYKYQPTINEDYANKIRDYLTLIYGQPQHGKARVTAQMVGSELQLIDIPFGKDATVHEWKKEYFNIIFIEGYKSDKNFYNAETNAYLFDVKSGSIEKGFVPANDYPFLAFRLNNKGRLKLGLDPIK